MTADQLLAQLGNTMSLPALALDANGCARIMVDGKISINFEVDAATGDLQLYSTLAPLPLPLAGRESIFLTLLQGNLFGAQTQGAALAVDTLYNEVVLCRSVATESFDSASFANLVEKFVAAAEDWSGRLAAEPSTTPAPAAHAPSSEALEPRVHGHFLRV